MLKKFLVEIVIPVYNEEKELEENVLRLYQFLNKSFNDFNWQITIADNASIDKTASIGKELARKYQKITYLYLPQKGRGRAVKKVWRESQADLLAYMDLDLSTDLKHFPRLIKSLISNFDLAIGSRLLVDSEVYHRSLKREILSRGYNFLIRLLFKTRFSDAQCGFKAITKKAAEEVLPLIKDNQWFMDTELLVLAEKLGYKIYEEPVAWRDNPGSTVRVLPTIIGDLKGLCRLFWQKPWRKIL